MGKYRDLITGAAVTASSLAASSSANAAVPGNGMPDLKGDTRTVQQAFDGVGPGGNCGEGLGTLALPLAVGGLFVAKVAGESKQRADAEEERMRDKDRNQPRGR